MNHWRFFKDSDAGAHTNTIEGTWAHVKRELIHGGTKKSLLIAYLATFMLRRRLKSEPDSLVALIQMANECAISFHLDDNHSLPIPGKLNKKCHVLVQYSYA